MRHPFSSMPAEGGASAGLFKPCYAFGQRRIMPLLARTEAWHESCNASTFRRSVCSLETAALRASISPFCWSSWWVCKHRLPVSSIYVIRASDGLRLPAVDCTRVMHDSSCMHHMPYLHGVLAPETLVFLLQIHQHLCCLPHSTTLSAWDPRLCVMCFLSGSKPPASHLMLHMTRSKLPAARTSWQSGESLRWFWQHDSQAHTWLRSARMFSTALRCAFPRLSTSSICSITQHHHCQAAPHIHICICSFRQAACILLSTPHVSSDIHITVQAGCKGCMFQAQVQAMCTVRLSHARQGPGPSDQQQVYTFQASTLNPKAEKTQRRQSLECDTTQQDCTDHYHQGPLVRLHVLRMTLGCHSPPFWNHNSMCEVPCSTPGHGGLQ